jgi:hypothetical protein
MIRVRLSILYTLDQSAGNITLNILSPQADIGRACSATGKW